MARPIHIERLNVDTFWAKVDRTGSCWLWQRKPNNKGYGMLCIAGFRVLAHRVSWVMANGCPIPNGLEVLHECDTPLCVNPAHLRVGTHADNLADAKAKGRMPSGDRNPSRLHPERLVRGDKHPARIDPSYLTRGENCHNALLNPTKVRDIRQRLANGEEQDALAAEYGVTQSSISHVATRKTWKHVD